MCLCLMWVWQDVQPLLRCVEHIRVMGKCCQPLTETLPGLRTLTIYRQHDDRAQVIMLLDGFKHLATG